MSAPRRSREVHAEGLDPVMVELARYILGADADGPHATGAAACVCEEPCRYCRCEVEP